MLNPTELSEAKRNLLKKYQRGERPQTTAQSLRAITQRSVGEATPLSFSQQQLWLTTQLSANAPVYNECVVVHVPGPLDVFSLEQSFNEIIRRHEAWRTCFPLLDGQPVQHIQSELTFSLPVIDLRDLPVEERATEALRRAKAETLLPFDLAHGPLLRATLMQLADEDHRLYLTLHHIIFDGVTIYQVFLPELRTLYEAFAADKPSPLPALPIQYADFAIWQRNLMQGKVLDEQLDYWQKQLANAPTLLALPTDHPYPPVPRYRGAVRSLALGQQLTDDLRAFCRKEGFTLYMLLHAALNTLLYRYTGQDDILVGTATSGRTSHEVQNLMGVFINMLVMRTNLTGNPSFLELLERVREATLEAQLYKDVPFELVVKKLQPEREPGRNPFFQVMLILEPPVAHLPSGWTLTHMEVHTDSSKFDLSLIFEDRPEGLLGWFEYNSDLFDAATVDRMIGHWLTLLRGIIADPTRSIDELPILTDAEQHQLLIEWNNTATDYSQAVCIHQMFDAQAERTPNAVALAFGEAQLTYHDVQQRANQLAHYLQGLGVGPEVLVGVCMQRSLDMVVALLAIFKAGGAYVPLDPAYPQERISFMLQDAQVAVLLTQQKLLENLPQQSAHVVCLDRDWKTIAHESDTNPVSSATPETLAYVIYTSGSTGRPKGVAIAHASVVTFIHWATSVFTPADLAGVLASTSICFDLSIFELFVPLSCGGSAIIVENVLSLPDVPDSTPVTLVNSVPSAITELLRHSKLPASAHTINLAGEALPYSLVQQLYQQETLHRVFNLYGPSEDTTYSTYTLVERGADTPTIGRPISNTQAYILDTHLQPVPIGIIGELYLAGEGLARGYLNRPELTAERFIHNPFSLEPKARMYKTGDLARYLPNGNIEFLGRSDHQVKIRGFRIEIGEIEEVLRQHSAVREAVVVVNEDIPGDKRLLAYVATHSAQANITSHLRSYLLEKLPGYMVPSAFVILDTLPRTPNGKLDRRALPAPQRLQKDKQRAEESFEAPLLTIHYQLTQIWEDLLNVQPISIKDNFFALGGHSLLAARLFNTIERIFGKKLPLSTLYSGATIEYLAEVIMGEENVSSRTPLVAVQVAGAKRPFFFLHGDWAGGGFYCLNLARDIGTDQPFYVLEPYKFEGMRVPPSLEAMASAHLKALQALQPEGPYLLGGFCNGGLMAYEIARQLQASGEEVEMLALIDPATPTPHGAVRKFIKRVGKLTGIREEKQLEWFLRYLYLRIPAYRKKVQNAMQQKDNDQVAHEQRPRKRGRLRRIQAHIAARVPAPAALRYPWAGIYRWVVADYMPGLYDGNITFLWSSEAYNHDSRWRKVAEAMKAMQKDTQKYIFPGTHAGCKTTNLPLIAERLKQSLQEIQGEADHS